MSAGVLILGGGLAGTAAAIELARAGRAVTLIEREASPVHKVCGEFLSAEALRALVQLGVCPEALGAVPIRSVRLGDVTESALPFAAMSLTRRSLDEALLQTAETAGARILRGQNVESLTRDGDLWHARITPHSNTLSAQNVFLATGKHDLRGHPRPPSAQNNLVAFKMYWRLAPPQQEQLAQHVELLLFRDGYAGLQPVEDGLVNLCCVLTKQRLREGGGNWEGVLAHMLAGCEHLRQRLHGATPALDRALAISSIPYGFVRSATDPGLWPLGDQTAVIPSFTGDGMSIALHSGSLAARMFLAGHTSANFQRTLHHRVHRQVQFATLLSRAMVSPLGQTVAGTLFRAWPGALSFIAMRTRLNDTRAF